VGASRKALCIAALMALAWAGSVCTAQVQTLKPLSNGRIQQGPYLLFGDPLGGIGIMKGSDIIVMGAGVFCGSSAGYWPYDRMPDKKFDLGNGTISFRGTIPAVGVTYNQQVSVEGNRIRIRVGRQGAWAGSHWQGWFLELPFNNYLGAQARADGKSIKLPETYSQAGETIATGVRRFECNVGDPSLNLVVECDRAMAIRDRRSFSSPRYLVSVTIPDAAGEFSDIYLTLPQAPESAAYAVRYSPIGYPVNGEKKVVLEWPKHMTRPADDRVQLQSADGTVVAEGRFGNEVTLNHIQSAFAMFDFTQVKQPGDYRIVWAGGRVEFPIRQSVFEDRLWEPTVDYFIPFQMCHAKVDLGPGIVGHLPCHMDDGIRVAAKNGRGGNDGFVSYECEGTPYKAGDPIPCAKGGWHDAGDCDLNIYAQGYATYMLALAYEEFGLDRDVSTLDVNAQTFTAGRPDGTPDVLQQVEWGALWLLSMIQADGRSYVGVVVQPNRRNNDITWDKMTDNRPGTGDERDVYVDYHAELQCMQAAALCAASRALRQARPPGGAEGLRVLLHAPRGLPGNGLLLPEHQGPRQQPPGRARRTLHDDRGPGLSARPPGHDRPDRETGPQLPVQAGVDSLLLVVRAAGARPAGAGASGRPPEGRLRGHVPKGGEVPFGPPQRAPLGGPLHGLRQGGRHGRAVPACVRCLLGLEGRGRCRVRGQGRHAHALDVRVPPVQRGRLRVRHRRRGRAQAYLLAPAPGRP
jgi:hypothetical protein